MFLVDKIIDVHIITLTLNTRRGGEMHQEPWEINSDLAADRLIKVASFIAAIRDDVIELHDEELGDTRLALGMRAYECCRSRIIDAAGSDGFPWLSILTAEGRFTFCIGSMPVRFTRNDPKQLPDRKLIVSENAMVQMNLFNSHPYADVRWFFVFDTHFKSAADAVYFVGYDSNGEIVCQWQVPIDDNVTLLAKVSDSVPQAVELDKPVVGVKKRVLKVETVSDEN